MASATDDSKYLKALRKSLRLEGKRSNFILPPPRNGVSPNYSDLLTYPHPNILKMEHYDPYIHTLVRHNRSQKAQRLCAKYALPVKSEGFRLWFHRQRQYIDSLSNRDVQILSSYTNVGDVLVNNFIRGTLRDLGELFTTNLDKVTVLGYFLYDNFRYFKTKMKLPVNEKDLMSQGIYYSNINVEVFNRIVSENFEFMRNPVNIAPLLEQYRDELTSIIVSAPRLLSPLTVYRGIQSERHLKDLQIISNDFWSTSTSIQAALNFAGLTEQNYPKGYEGVRYYGGIYEINLTEDIPCLYMESITECAEEFEVLLPPGLQYEFDSRIFYKVLPPEIDDLSFFSNSSERPRVGIVHVAVEDVSDPPMSNGDEEGGAGGAGGENYMGGTRTRKSKGSKGSRSSRKQKRSRK